ncbi:hypothetical protein [Sphingomonas sp. TX0522]|uniref:hypothetical protein n=1 Tax=Sphingomonas sp. TX0522 TaxID=2479205 RepID=UPI0018DFBF13|nr:hypothetical protein [Sphingomonas sp. TX0522]
MLVSEPDGVEGTIDLKTLLGRLIATDVATATLADLSQQLGYPANAIALVFADHDPGANGWYRKLGAVGAGSWSFFEPLAAVAVLASKQALTFAERAEIAAEIAQFASLKVYDTKALAIAALAMIADDEKIGVEADESLGGVRAVYRKSAGGLTLVTNLSAIGQPVSINFLPTAVDANGGGSQVLWRRKSAAGDGWGDLTSSTSASVITDPYRTYADNVYMLWGFNATVSFGVRDTTKPMSSERIEERYYGANTDYALAAERHLTTTPAGSDREIRWYSGYLTLRVEDWRHSGWSWQLANFVWYTPFGTDIIEQWSPRDGDAAANGYFKSVVKKSITFIANNGYAHTLQSTRDGAGSIASPYVSARDELQIDASTVTAAQPRTNVFGQRALTTTLVDNPIDGDTVLFGRTSGDPVAGTLYSRRHFGDADEFSDYMFNGKIGGRVVHHLFALGGDAFGRYEAPSRTISAGLRYSDTRYVIGRGSDLSDELVSVDRATGRASFAGPISKPIYTVATLPNPTLVPPGTEVFCSDETGGGVPVFSDGTNWRRCTDRAVAS